MAWAAPVALALQGVSSIVQGVGQYQYYRQAAKQAEQEAALSVATERRKLLRQQGSVRARYLASGVALDGTPIDVLDDLTGEGELQALALRYQGQKAAYESIYSARRAAFGAATSTLESALATANQMYKNDLLAPNSKSE